MRAERTLDSGVGDEPSIKLGNVSLHKVQLGLAGFDFGLHRGQLRFQHVSLVSQSLALLDYRLAYHGRHYRLTISPVVNW